MWIRKVYYELFLLFVKETADSDDPLSRKRTGMFYPVKSALPVLTGMVIPIDEFAVYELILVFILLAVSLFLSGIRASYATAGAMENPWERKGVSEGYIPTRIQQLALSIIQRGVTLLALLLAARFTWLQVQHNDQTIFHWISLGSLAFWIWLDVIIRFYAARNAVEFIPKIAGITHFIIKVCEPLTKPITKLGYVFGILTPEGSEISTERLEAKAESEEETDLLRGLANFRQTNARKAMQPRMNINAFDIELNFHELMDKINKSGYSRVPVYRDTLDSVEGILNVKDLLPHLHHNEHFNWQKLLRVPYLIPESKRLDDLMKDFQSRRVHMAIVINEYGGTSGLITLEDIIEEIFGDINDEYDEEDEVNYTKVDENTYVFEGMVLINDLCRILNLESDYFDEVRGNSESLAGLLLELFSRLPRTGEIATHRGITFKVQSADKKRIKKVRVLVG
ncbi:transporter associated domain-containing protein [Dyadobacter sp. CY356]|uniref:transporter associated domain-containing protein n=1 Tax=Dyadobacter sp. CY356 TaxID=2906442 RepID=UPI001F2F254E|nr:transporter associated domain-containing protein [Dyadobacter sp. CY356]MCF0057441.1 CBS domain-containing protein [Dyadobacter sp. CY356]